MQFDVSSPFTRRVVFLIDTARLRFSERKAESGFELSRAEAGSQYSLRVKLLQRNGPCFDAERLLVSNCTAKVQPFYGALRVFSAYCGEAQIIAVYCYKKRAKNLRMSLIFSTFVA